MATILQHTKDLCAMVGNGQILDAVRTYYAEDATMVEATGDTFHGRDTQVKRMEDWLAGIKERHDGGVRAITANEDDGVSMVESWVDLTFQDGNRMTMEEIERYRWEDGKITHARFYYNMPPMPDGA